MAAKKTTPKKSAAPEKSASPEASETHYDPTRVYHLPCSSLSLVGVDLPADDYPSLQDERIAYPLGIERIENQKTYGVLTPVLFVTDGERKLVVDGKTRVRIARVLSEEAPQLVPAVDLGPYDAGRPLAEYLDAANVRTDTLPSAMAAKIVRHKARTPRASWDKIGQIFGISGQSARIYAQFYRTPPDLKAAVDEGEVTFKSAYPLGRIADASEMRIAADELMGKTRVPTASGDEGDEGDEVTPAPAPAPAPSPASKSATRRARLDQIDRVLAAWGDADAPGHAEAYALDGDLVDALGWASGTGDCPAELAAAIKAAFAVAG